MGHRVKFARIRVHDGNRWDSYTPHQHIDGDKYSTNSTYKEAIRFIVNWKPNLQIKEFVDKYCPDYKNKIQKDHIEVTLYYPLDTGDLMIYLEENSILIINNEQDLNDIIENNNIEKLAEIYERKIKNVI